MTSSELAFLGLLAALYVERLVELVVSRRNAARLLARGAVEAGAGHFPAMAAMHALFPLSCAAEVLLLDRAAPGALAFAALAVALAAQGLRWWAIATLGGRWTVRVLVLPGAPPVTGGPYRLVRHPNYLAVCLELAAIPLVHGALATAVAFSALNAVVLAVRIRAEERALGAGYGVAFSHVPRFVPEVRR